MSSISGRPARAERHRYMSARRAAALGALALAGALYLGACSGGPPQENRDPPPASPKGRDARVSAAPFRNLGKRAESGL